MKKMLLALLPVLAMAAVGHAADVSGIAKSALAQVPAGTIAFQGRNGWLYS